MGRHQISLSVLRGVQSVGLVELAPQVFVVSPVVAVLDAKRKDLVVFVLESGFESKNLLVLVLDFDPKSFDLAFGSPSFGPGTLQQLCHLLYTLHPVS